MLKLLSTLSRVGLTTLQDLVAGNPADDDRAASSGADDVWFRPARVQLLEDRRVLAVSIVPDVASITANEGASVNLSAELQGGTSGQSYDVSIDWGDGSTPSIVTVVAAANGLRRCECCAYVRR
jgi:hypothetical protein